ncbi:MAG: serine/threonine-protein phosphatase [Actinobacteria bacterium]|nr:serine/threonine-protein phosphatase [Actinomycetota bacterium]
MEEAAGYIARFFYENLIDKETGDRSCALVRLYKSHEFARLEPDLRAYLNAMTAPEVLNNDTPCLTLLGTVGDEPGWNERSQSRWHRSVPLTDREALNLLPMVSQLVQQLGLTLEEATRIDPDLFIDLDQRNYNVFFVEDAVGHPAIPAQEEFVVPYGIRSVLGFGGVLPDGSLFAVILFSNVTIPRETADLFASVALSVKLLLLQTAACPVFESQREFPEDLQPNGVVSEKEALQAQVSALEQLLNVRSDVVASQALRLEHALEAAETRAAEVALSEHALMTSQRRLEHIAKTLQKSLLPPVLPAIEWLEVAGAYHPAGAGSEVGGDFYDVFETARGDWAITLGDVVGKGPKAASLTGLARYTLRAAAIHSRQPAEVLAVLNEAIAQQHPDEYCTIAYCRLRKRPSGIVLTTSSGGHPSPLILRSDGIVQEACEPGLIVGAFPNWKGDTSRKYLEPGDTLVLYSDGVTDARRGADFFGEERLRRHLSAHRHLTATGIAESLSEEVLAHQEGSPSDDIAILVAKVKT